MYLIKLRNKTWLNKLLSMVFLGNIKANIHSHWKNVTYWEINILVGMARNTCTSFYKID